LAFKQQNNTFTDSFVDSRLEYVDSFPKSDNNTIKKKNKEQKSQSRKKLRLIIKL